MFYFADSSDPNSKFVLKKYASISRRLLEITLDDLEAARSWLQVLGRNTSREKIASMLFLFHQHYARLNQVDIVDGATICLPLSREDAADFLGLTPETVSRRFSDLKRDGIIVPKGTRHIQIPSFKKLARETGDSYGWWMQISDEAAELEWDGHIRV